MLNYYLSTCMLRSFIVKRKFILFIFTVTIVLVSAFYGCQKNEYDNPHDSSVSTTIWAPRNLMVQQTSLKTVSLTWIQPDQRIDSFCIEAKRGFAEWKVVGYSNKTKTSFIDNTFIPDANTPVEYRVSAMAWKNKGYSETQKITPTFVKPVMPNAQKDLGVRIKLTWYDTYTNEDSYKVEKKVYGGNWVLCADTIRANSTYYYDNTPELNAQITYRLSARAEGIYSDTTSSNTVSTIISPPTWLTVASLSQTSCRIDWKQGDMWTTGYNIDRQIGSNLWQNGWLKLDNSKTTFTDTGFPTDQDMKYRVSTIVNNNLSSYVELAYAVAQLDTITSSNITYTSVTVKSSVTSEPGAPVTEWGIVYGTNPNPTITDTKITATTAGSVPLNTKISGLNNLKTYYFRAYAINRRGESYGKQKTITLLQNTAPQLDGISFINISYESASVKSNILTDGNCPIIEAGSVYSTNPGPTINDNKLTCNYQADLAGVYALQTYMNNLTNGATYYVRPFARNSMGLTYGPEKILTLLPYRLPVLDTLSVISVEAARVCLRCTLKDEGGDDVTIKRGFVWGLNINPTINDNIWTDQSRYSLNTIFTNYNTGFTPNQVYHARAYCQNRVGIVYSNDKVFKTQILSTPKIDTLMVGSVTYTSAAAVSQITGTGGIDLIEGGFVMSTSPDPTVNDTKVNCTLSAPDYIMRFTFNSLLDNQTYYLRAFARNAQGITYSNNAKFTTLGMTLGQIGPLQITYVTASSAIFYSDISSNGGDPNAEAGFVYGDNPGPTLADNQVLSEPGWMVNIQGANKRLYNLLVNHKYYARSYIKNVKGTVYSPDNSFTTIQVTPPVVDSVKVLSNTAYSMSLYGHIISDGQGTISQAGFVYATTPNPTLSNTTIIPTLNPLGSGQYSMNTLINGLTPGVTYYICAFATNSRGTTFGPQLVKVLP